MSIIVFDDYRNRLTPDEKKEISLKVVQKYQTTPPPVSPADKTIRPIEHFCRNCHQRAPFERSKYCKACIDLRARVDREQSRFFPGVGYVLVFGLVVFLIWWSFAGWLDVPDFQRSSQNNTQIHKR